MNSYNFEVIAKNALIKHLEGAYNEILTIDELHLVWFSKNLQNYKAVIVDLRDNQRYYEVTYNGDKDEMYLDFYEKQMNIKVPSSDFNSKVGE